MPSSRAVAMRSRLETSPWRSPAAARISLIRDENGGFSIAKNAGLPPQVVLQHGPPEGRVDRDRNRSREKNAEETGEESPARSAA